MFADGKQVDQSCRADRRRSRHRGQRGASLCLARRRQALGRARPFRLRPERPRLPRCRRLDRRLHAGAARARRCKVYAVDVGSGQLHDTVRARPEVVSLEQTDIRTLTPAQLTPPPDLVVIDVSFISLKLVLPPALALAHKPAQLIALIKPQFEAGRARAQARHRARHSHPRGGLRRHCRFRDIARLARHRRHPLADQRRRRQCRIPARCDTRAPRHHSSVMTMRVIITFHR